MTISPCGPIKAPSGHIIDDQGNIITGTWRIHGAVRINEHQKMEETKYIMYYFETSKPKEVRDARSANRTN